MEIPIGRRPALALVAAVLAGCARGDAGEAKAPEVACAVVEKGITLPEELRESSGIVASRRHAGVYWSHNDSGRHPDLFAVGLDGQLLGKMTVTGAQNNDWEDIALGPCPGGGGDCLYLADTGNNGKKRRHVTLWVFPEPVPGDGATAPAREFKARFPGDPTDIEALAVLPDGRVLLVSKGNNDVVELIRWPTPLQAGIEPTLEPLRQLAPEPTELGDRVTGASASPDGRFVAVRTYAALAIYRTAGLLGTGTPIAQLDLDPLAETQGEAVSLANDGSVVLTSEGPGSKHLPGTISRLRCALPR
ncbi:hypothetical protein [Longimicrobium sp.]|uniref:hypothetical protein n=1 Tax=Longimicrobium sp. TaxID=2029185 RepID=UPI002BD1C7E3|nr:hypothetical protein [Longimicrobium sp.]HSU14291.1 hypothetical protein [Longimicrobium sp.]